MKAEIKSFSGSDKVDNSNNGVAKLCGVLAWIFIICGIISGIVIFFDDEVLIGLASIMGGLLIGAGFLAISRVLYYLDGIYSRLYAFNFETKENSIFKN